jgi:hypothetical protein
MVDSIEKCHPLTNNLNSGESFSVENSIPYGLIFLDYLKSIDRGEKDYSTEGKIGSLFIGNSDKKTLFSFLMGLIDVDETMLTS